MPYAEISAIAEGSLDEERTFTDETLLAEYVAAIEAEAQAEGYRAEIYRLDHDHEPGIDCECIQFAQDHRPYRVFNPEGND